MIFSEHGTHRKNGDLFTHCLSSAEFIKLRKCRRPTDQREVTFLFATCILKSVSLPSFLCVPWSKPNQGASPFKFVRLLPAGQWGFDKSRGLKHLYPFISLIPVFYLSVDSCSSLKSESRRSSSSAEVSGDILRAQKAEERFMRS